MKHFSLSLIVLLMVASSSVGAATRLTPTPTPFFDYTGDVNTSYTLTAEDSQHAFMLALGYWSPTPAADCNADGDITAGDSQAIFLGLFHGSYCMCPVPSPPGTFTPTPTPVLPENRVFLGNGNIGCPGNTVELPVRMINPDYAVDCFSLEIYFDPEVMTLQSVDAGDLDPGWQLFDGFEVAPGIVRVAGWSLSQQAIPEGSNGELAELNFLTLCNDCYDGESFPLEFGWMADDIMPFTAEDDIVSINCINHLHNGDANLDHMLSSGDAQLTFMEVLGLVTFSFQQFICADCNGDHELTSEDAQMIFGTLMGYDQCDDPI